LARRRRSSAYSSFLPRDRGRCSIPFVVSRFENRGRNFRILFFKLASSPHAGQGGVLVSFLLIVSCRTTSPYFSSAFFMPKQLVPFSFILELEAPRWCSKSEEAPFPPPLKAYLRRITPPYFISPMYPFPPVKERLLQTRTFLPHRQHYERTRCFFLGGGGGGGLLFLGFLGFGGRGGRGTC